MRCYAAMAGQSRGRGTAIVPSCTYCSARCSQVGASAKQTSTAELMLARRAVTDLTCLHRRSFAPQPHHSSCCTASRLWTQNPEPCVLVAPG